MERMSDPDRSRQASANGKSGSNLQCRIYNLEWNEESRSKVFRLAE